MESPTTWPVAENALDGDEVEEEEEEEEEGDEAITKKLVFDCAETPSRPELRRKVAAASKKQSVLTYLRIRPKSQREIKSMDASCLHLLNDRELEAVAPVSSQTFKNKLGARCLSDSTQQFGFTHIFDEGASQRDVFEEALVPTLRDFFDGQNCLVFTYGVTNSGKTYTVTGTLTEPGILPRSLDLIFNSVSPQQMSSLELRPKNFSEAVYLTEEEAASELTRRESILNKARTGEGVTSMEETADTDTSSNISTLSKASSNYSKVSEPGASLCEIQVQDGSTIDLEDSGVVCYSFWVSFAEIYNEFIYDLLADEPNKSRRGRRLAEDKNHNHFVKGLLEVRVESVEEALLLLRMGVTHRHVAATNLNYQSSRSHTVFTVKMIKVLAGSDKPRSALVNRVSIVDLAGAERSKETGAKGIRVKEAGKINNSLLTLGKCIEAMRHNQNRRKGEEHIVPFRDSKLTRLFQNYFIGKGRGMRQGKITMLVNVSNNASVFDETIHVLKFSAITSKVIPIVKETVHVSQPRPLPSSRVLRSRTVRRPAAAVPPAATPVVGKSSRAPVVNEDNEKTIEAKRTVSIVVCEDCEMKKEKISSLRRRLGALEVEKMESEYQIRQEVCREFQEQLVDIEETHREELEEQAEDMQEMYDKRMELLQKSMKKEFNRKRRRVEPEEEGEEGRERGEVDHLRDTIARLEEVLQSEREQNVVLSAELKDATETHESQVTRLNKQVNSVSLRVVEAEGRARQLEEELAHTRRQVTEKERQPSAEQERLANEAAERERERLATQQKLETELGTVRTELEEKERALVDNQEKVEAELSALRAQLAGSKGEAVDAGSQLKENQDMLDGLHAQLARAEEEATEREKELQKSQEKLKELESELARVERERTEAVDGTCEALQLQVQELSARMVEKEADNEALKSERLSLISEYESREGQLREEIGRLKCELERASQASGGLEREEWVRQVEAGREDAVAEVEILQARISELTREAAELRQQAAAECAAETTTSEASSEEVALLRSTVLGLEAQLQEKETELKSLQTDNQTSSHTAQQEISSLQEQVEGLQSQLAASQTSSHMAQQEISSLQEQVEGLQSQLAASQTSSNTSQREISSLREQVEGLQSQLTASQTSSNTAQQEISSQQEQVEGFQSQLAASQTSSHTAQQELSSLVEGLQSQLTASQTSSHTAQQEIFSLQEQVEGLQSQLAASQTSSHTAQQEIFSLQEQVEGLQSQLAASQTSSHTAQQEISSLREQAEGLQSQLTASQTSSNTAQQEISSLQEQVEGLQSQLAASQTSSHTAQTEISSLQEQVEGLQSQLTASQTSSNTSQQEISSLVEGLQSQLTASQTSSHTAQQEISSLREQVEGLQSQLAASQTSSHTAQQEISSLQEQVEGLQSQLAASQTSSHMAQQEISSLQEQVEGLESELAEKGRIVTALQAAKAVLADKLQTRAASLLDQVMSVKVELSSSCTELGQRCGVHSQLVQRLAEGVAGEREALKNEVRELRAQLVARETELRELTASVVVQPVAQDKEMGASGTETTSEEEMQSPEDELEEDSATDTQKSDKVNSGLPRSDSKPYVAVLERSSLLVEDPLPDTASRVVIDATPPIARRRGRKHKHPAKENMEDEGTPKKYPRRTRKKPQRFEEHDRIPSLKALLPRIRPRKALSSTQPSPTASPSSPPPPPRLTERATRSTRFSKVPIRKSQISGPLGLAGTGSPALPLSRCSADIGPRAPPLYHDHCYT